MPHVYILKNGAGKYYIGITSISVEARLGRHNKGNVYSTKIGRPWEIIYSEYFVTVSEARIREKQIKGWKGGNAFKKLLSKAAGSSNGRIEDSESFHLGSNPSPAALERRHEFGEVEGPALAG